MLCFIINNRTKETMENYEKKDEEIPEVVTKEADDKPADRNIIRVIFIVVVLLAIIYFLFFRNDASDVVQ